MRWMQTVLGLLCVLAILGLLSTFAIEASYTARAQKVQLVRIDKTQHNPLGPVTVDQGEPQTAIVSDKAALLKNKTPMGLPMLDADYLAQHQGAALVLTPIFSTIGLARIGCILSILVTACGCVLITRLRSIAIPDEPEE